MTQHNPAPSPSGHPLLSGPPTLSDIHRIFTRLGSSCLWSEPWGLFPRETVAPSGSTKSLAGQRAQRGSV
eukprot:scaffold101175_cov45-Phaeocystis_antarctica.AAC.1